MVLSRCSSERGEREKRSGRGSENVGERRRSNCADLVGNSLNR